MDLWMDGSTDGRLDGWLAEPVTMEGIRQD